MARAVIMSGAYEHNWKKHPVLAEAFGRWQNQLPLCNLRLGNLFAAVIRPQLAELPRRVGDGRGNHDHVAALLNASPWINVPRKLEQVERAPESIQFNLCGPTTEQIDAFVASSARAGVTVQVFGRSTIPRAPFGTGSF